jgi:hypothetical protein
MSHDPIDNWIEKAKMSAQDNSEPSQSGVKVIRRPAKTRGNVIMDIAEKLRPILTKMFEGARDENGMLVQPARVRAIALNVAQDIIKEQEQKVA